MLLRDAEFCTDPCRATAGTSGGLSDDASCKRRFGNSTGERENDRAAGCDETTGASFHGFFAGRTFPFDHRKPRGVSRSKLRPRRDLSLVTECRLGAFPTLSACSGDRRGAPCAQFDGFSAQNQQRARGFLKVRSRNRRQRRLLLSWAKAGTAAPHAPEACCCGSWQSSAGAWGFLGHAGGPPQSGHEGPSGFGVGTVCAASRNCS
jgi:hypothetical protein